MFKIFNFIKDISLINAIKYYRLRRSWPRFLVEISDLSNPKVPVDKRNLSCLRSQEGSL